MPFYDDDSNLFCFSSTLGVFQLWNYVVYHFNFNKFILTTVFLRFWCRKLTLMARLFYLWSERYLGGVIDMLNESFLHSQTHKRWTQFHHRPLLHLNESPFHLFSLQFNVTRHSTCEITPYEINLNVVLLTFQYWQLWKLKQCKKLFFVSFDRTTESCVVNLLRNSFCIVIDRFSSHCLLFYRFPSTFNSRCVTSRRASFSYRKKIMDQDSFMCNERHGNY